MKYKVVTTQKFDKAFMKLDKHTQRMIKSWIDKNLVGTEDPRHHEKRLTSNRRGQWRYRIGDYRILADIRDSELVIVAIGVGHRRDVYN